MPETEETLAVRVELGELAFVQQLSEVLSDLDRAYNALYYFLDLSHDIEDFYRRWRPYWPELPPFVPFTPTGRTLGSPRRVQRGATIIVPTEDFSTFVLPSDRLVLRRCKIGSPGWMDILGKFNPLKVLRDIHEIRKDREYRENAERERLHLENEILRNQVIRQRIDILKELGFPRSAIKEFVNTVLKEPIKAFERQIQSGNIRDLKAILSGSDEQGPGNDPQRM